MLGKKPRGDRSPVTKVIVRCEIKGDPAEFFLGPLLGRPPDPFFVLPINPHNIDGLIDVTVGMLGTLVAWYK